MTPASATLRVGSHAPVPLLGIPVVSPDYKPGEVTIILGYMSCGVPGHTSCGKPVTVTIGSLEWTEDLEDACRVAFAGGVIRTGMHLAEVIR